jgi:histidine triad (HIT) family protein
MDCIFCKIANKEVESDLLYESDNVVAFNDINPEMPVHILIVPKRHLPSIKEMQAVDKELIGEMFLVAKELAEKNNLTGYKLAINVGRDGGQIIDHLHLHLLGRPKS